MKIQIISDLHQEFGISDAIHMGILMKNTMAMTGSSSSKYKFSNVKLS